jgi:hypothetical protein
MSNGKEIRNDANVVKDTKLLGEEVSRKWKSKV